MKAPSEKHLEDYLWQHPEALGMMEIPEEWGSDDPVHNFVTRQLRLPSGIADLISVSWATVFTVIELKRGDIDSQAFTQLMRYRADINWIFEDIQLQYARSQKKHWEYLMQQEGINGSMKERMLDGLLIGHAVPDRNLLYACEARRVGVILYDYDIQNGYTFECVSTHTVRDYEWQTPAIDQLKTSKVGRVIEKLITDHLAFVHETQPGDFDAIVSANSYINSLDGRV